MLPKPVHLGATDTLKVILTTQNGKQARRPHQAFLLLKDPATGLDISYPFSVKESGKAKVDVVRRYPINRQGTCRTDAPHRRKKTFQHSSLARPSSLMLQLLWHLSDHQIHTTTKLLPLPLFQIQSSLHLPARNLCATANSLRYTTSSAQIPKAHHWSSHFSSQPQ